jgi:CRISPR-associated protein Cas6
MGQGLLAIPRGAALRLRLPVDQIATALPLAGKTLKLGAGRLVFGAPAVHALVPAPSLDARLVVVKLTDVPTRDHPSLGRRSLDRPAIAERVKTELMRQLKSLGVDALVELRGHGRITVAGRVLLGFSVRVSDLDAEASIKLQERGLGGKRRMGCGMFRPSRKR